MPRNYDTTTGRPYPRVQRIEIVYPESGIPIVHYEECTAVVDADGMVQTLAATPQRHALSLPAPTEPVQVVLPSTGAAIEGQTATVQGLMLAMLAMIRRDQLARDAASDVPAP